MTNHKSQKHKQQIDILLTNPLARVRTLVGGAQQLERAVHAFVGVDVARREGRTHHLGIVSFVKGKSGAGMLKIHLTVEFVIFQTVLTVPLHQRLEIKNNNTQTPNRKHTRNNIPERVEAVGADDHQTVSGLVPVNGLRDHVDLADESTVFPVEEHHTVGAADGQTHAAVDAWKMGGETR